MFAKGKDKGSLSMLLHVVTSHCSSDTSANQVSSPESTVGEIRLTASSPWDNHSIYTLSSPPAKASSRKAYKLHVLVTMLM